MLSEQINPRALIANYEHSNLNQQGSKESIKLYEELMQTVYKNITKADVSISEVDIFMCH